MDEKRASDNIDIEVDGFGHCTSFDALQTQKYTITAGAFLKYAKLKYPFEVIRATFYELEKQIMQ